MAQPAPDWRFDALAGAALVIAAMTAVLYATATGIGVTPDSTAYFANARWWLQQIGVAVRGGPVSNTTYFGPLYPLTLAATSFVLRQDPSVAARWLAVIVLPVNALLMAHVVRRAVSNTRYAPWAAALIFLAAPDLLVAHTMAWSEPIFITLVLLAVVALDAYLERPRPWRLIALAVIVAAACLQRFAGAALLFMATFAIVLWGRDSRWQRAGSAALIAVIALLPTLVWMLLSPGFQGLAYHPVSIEWAVSAWPTVARWVVPDDVPVSEGARVWSAGAAVFGVAGIVAYRSTSRIAALLGAFLVSYTVVLFAAACFWDVTVTPTGRLLTPCLVAVIPLVAIGIAQRCNQRVVHRTSFAVVCAWALVLVSGSSAWLARTHAEGQGYTSRAWQDAEIIRTVRELPARTFLVSAANDAISAVTGRPASRLPDRINPGTLAPNPEYAAELARLADRLRATDGVIVFFDRLRDRPYIPGESDLAREWNLVLVVRTRDGALYRLRRSGE